MKISKLIFLFFVFWISTWTTGRAEDVQIQTRDGIRLVGTLDMVPQSKGAVILVHMLNHDRKDWTSFSHFLNQNGWDTLSIDLRGHGQSKGTDEQKLDWQEFSKEDFRKMTEDLDAAFQFLKTKEKPAPSHLFMVGASIGANLSLEYASKNPEISGVVLLSPGVDYRGVRPKQAAMEYKDRPVLLIASQEDTFSVSSSDFLYQLIPAEKKEIIKLQAKGHGTDMLGNDLELKEKILAFLSKQSS